MKSIKTLIKSIPYPEKAGVVKSKSVQHCRRLGPEVGTRMVLPNRGFPTLAGGGDPGPGSHQLCAAASLSGAMTKDSSAAEEGELERPSLTSISFSQ